MSSDEEQEIASSMKRKRGRPSKSDQESSPRKGKKVSDDDMDGIHYACDVRPDASTCHGNFMKSGVAQHSAVIPNFRKFPSFTQ